MVLDQGQPLAVGRTIGVFARTWITTGTARRGVFPVGRRSRESLPFRPGTGVGRQIALPGRVPHVEANGPGIVDVFQVVERQFAGGIGRGGRPGKGRRHLPMVKRGLTVTLDGIHDHEFFGAPMQIISIPKPGIVVKPVRRDTILVHSTAFQSWLPLRRFQEDRRVLISP